MIVTSLLTTVPAPAQERSTWHVSPGLAAAAGGRLGAEVSLFNMRRWMVPGFCGIEVAGLGVVVGVDDFREQGAGYGEFEVIVGDLLAPRGRFFHVLTLGAGPRASAIHEIEGWQTTLGIAFPPIPPLLYGRWVETRGGGGRGEIGLMLKLPLEL